MQQVAEIDSALLALGQRLRRARLERNESMALFGQRIRVSEQTVRAMERGFPTVQIGTWLEALWILDELEPLDRLIEKRESLLDIARRERGVRQRLRASKRGKGRPAATVSVARRR